MKNKKFNFTFTKFIFLFLSFIIILIFLRFINQSETNSPKSSHFNSIKYQLVRNWPDFPKNFILGNPSGIAVDTNQNIVVFYRSSRDWPLVFPMPTSLIKSNTIAVLDRNTGKILISWGSNKFIMPHGLTVDKNNNIWVTDCGLNQIFKFSEKGQLLLSIGEPGVAGNDSSHFNRPTDIAVADDGSFFVADGYRNSRIIKYSQTGEFLTQWGTWGTKPGQFIIPHSICLDNSGNIIVADRENSRIQFFNSKGKFITQWKNSNNSKFYSVAYDKTNNCIITTDYLNYLIIHPVGSNITCYNKNGDIEWQFGRSGNYKGEKTRYHDLAIDKDGNLYVEDILQNQIQKFEKIMIK